MSEVRRAMLPALAKINLDLRVLGKRADGYHELRTIFQTISLADSIDVTFSPGGRTSIVLDDPLRIPDNLVERAARLVMKAMRASGRVEIGLKKRIPMGAGLGGGSSDAAAILLACRRSPAVKSRCRGSSTWRSNWAATCHSFCSADARRASGAGRSCFRCPICPRNTAFWSHPGVHVSTAEAYRVLGARLTTELQQNKIVRFPVSIMGAGVCQGGG